MKILIIGKDNIMKWPQNTANGLKALGHKTELFLYNKKSILKSFAKRHNQKMYKKILINEMNKKLKKLKPDLIIIPFVFFTPEVIFKNLPKNIKTIGWTGDKFSEKETSKANKLDYLLCTDTGYINIAKKLKFKCKTDFLPHAFNPNLFKKKNKKRKMDAFFVGNSNPKRHNIFSKLKNCCTIFGNQWKIKKLKQHSVKNKTISLKNLPKYYNNTKIAITINAPYNNINGMNMRIFESSACGCLVATDNVKDLHQCYNKNEVAIYKTPKELDEIITKIKNNDPKLLKIAENGYKRSQKDHAYPKRMEQLLKMINKK